VRGDTKKNLSERLDTPADAARIRNDIEHEMARRGGASRVVVYDHPEKNYIEKSLADVAADLKKSPADAAIHLQMTGYDRPGGGRMRGYSLSEIDIEHIMRSLAAVRDPLDDVASSSDYGAEGPRHPPFRRLGRLGSLRPGGDRGHRDVHEPPPISDRHPIRVRERHRRRRQGHVHECDAGQGPHPRPGRVANSGVCGPVAQPFRAAAL
jgi:hypothetical protein